MAFPLPKLTMNYNNPNATGPSWFSKALDSGIDFVKDKGLDLVKKGIQKGIEHGGPAKFEQLLGGGKIKMRKGGFVPQIAYLSKLLGGHLGHLRPHHMKKLDEHIRAGGGFFDGLGSLFGFGIKGGKLTAVDHRIGKVFEQHIRSGKGSVNLIKQLMNAGGSKKGMGCVPIVPTRQGVGIKRHRSRKGGRLSEGDFQTEFDRHDPVPGGMFRSRRGTRSVVNSGHTNLKQNGY